jgi:lysophospholipase L1-like esterase
MKRIIFFFIMVAIPLAVLTAGLVAYVKLTDSNSINRWITSYFRRTEPLGPYKANWAQVNTLVPVPYVGGHYKPGIRGPYVNTNDLGYRGVIHHERIIEEARALKSDGFKIVIFTGGSAAFGAYSDDDETTITAYLNLFLSKAGRRVKVYNFAMGSYTSDDELASLVMYASDTHPDLLIVMDGYNDSLRGALEPYTKGVGIPYAYDTIRKAYQVPFQSVFLDKKYEVGSAEAFDAITQRYERNLKRMKLFMEITGGQVIFATQPLKHYNNNTVNCQQDKEDFLDLVIHQYPQLIRTSQDAAGSEGYLNLSNAFSTFTDACSFFIDRIHMSSAGQKIVARQLLPLMLRKLHIPELTEVEQQWLQ